MSKWEAKDSRQLSQLLVGDYYGERPEQKLAAIRTAKQNRAAQLCKKLGCNRESVVLEVGSGMGLASKHIARRVKALHCCDISESFLAIAKKECTGIDNIEFHKIEHAVLPFPDAFFDIIFADAVFIHLNLYDIFWYFTEFQRLAKKGAKVHINVSDGSKMDMDKLSEMAGYYRKDRASLDRLLCWNSVPAVISVGSRFGFKLTLASRLRRLRGRETVDLLFVKG